MPIASPSAYNEPVPVDPRPARPYQLEHRIFWADVDLAQIAYTGHIPNYGLKTIDAFWDALLGADWARLNIDHGIATPFVHVSVDIHSPVTFREMLVTTLHVAKIGQSSITFEIDGHQGERLCFTSKFVSVFVSSLDFAKMPIPPMVRGALELQAGTRA